jgi:hypothetical protein
VKYLYSFKYTQLTLVKKTGIKNLGHVRPDRVISQLSSNNKQRCVKKFKPPIYAKHKGLSGSAERNALICFPCLLFGGDTACTKTGVTDWKH